MRVFGQRSIAVAASALALVAAGSGTPAAAQQQQQAPAANRPAPPAPAPPAAPGSPPAASVPPPAAGTTAQPIIPPAITAPLPAAGASPAPTTGAAQPAQPAAAGPASASPAPAATRQSPIAETPFAQVFADLAGRVVGTVVNISTEGEAPAARAQAAPQNSAGTTLDEVFRDFFGENGTAGAPGAPAVASLGSGFIIDPSGLIVTNNHVIANAQQITVTLSDNTALQAKVVGRDPVTDLALLKVDAKTPLPAAQWGDSNKARVGDWVLTIGNPFGLGGSVTSGIISATARDIHSSPYDDYLQTDASINRGNSGGPMFDLAGDVIGINTVIYSPSGGSIGIGFALPSALARPIIEQLKATGKVERGWIGAHIQPMTDELAASVGLDKSRGAMIAAIEPDSPAAQAKLEPGDVILSYDGQAIERSRQLPRLVAATPPDKEIKLQVWHDGKQQDVTLKTVALDPNRKPPPPPEPAKPKPPTTVEAFGLKLAKLTPELRKQFSLPDGANGVVITEVAQNSPGAGQGLRPGDIVLAIGRTSVASPQQVPPLAAAAKKANQKMLLVQVEQREGGTRFVALPSEAG